MVPQGATAWLEKWDMDTSRTIGGALDLEPRWREFTPPGQPLAWKERSVDVFFG
jgi:hypothetical protein